MKHTLVYFSILHIWCSLSSCGERIAHNEVDGAFEEFVFGVRLVEDSSMIEKYLDYHENIWPEVEQGFRKAGYKNIRLYNYGNYITMVVKVPNGSDLNEMGVVSNNSYPRVKEWNTLMNRFQKGFPGVEVGKTWIEMDKIYEFSN